METAFRVAIAADKEKIFTLFKQVILQMEFHKIDQWDDQYPTFEDITLDIDNQDMFVLLLKNEIIAAITLNEEQEEDEYKKGNWIFVNGRIAVIHRLCVDPSYQNQGIAKNIMFFAEKQLYEKGYSAIRLDTFSQNTFAIKLYEKLGYSRAGEVFFRKGKFYLYEKSLRKAEEKKQKK